MCKSLCLFICYCSCGGATDERQTPGGGAGGSWCIPQLLDLFIQSAVLLSSFCALSSHRASGLLNFGVDALLFPSNPVLPGGDAPFQLLNMLL